MAVIRTIVRELLGLFVDDGSLALATLATLSAIAVARYVGFIGGTGAALLLCAGFSVVLVENVLRSARGSDK